MLFGKVTITRITNAITILMKLLCSVSTALTLTEELAGDNMHAHECQYINAHSSDSV